MAHPKPVVVRFDERVWQLAIHPFSTAAQRTASNARRLLERDGIRHQDIDRRYEARGPKGTRLPACVKVYVPLGLPTSEQPYGIVLQLQDDGSLAFIAFGRRHPAGAERDVDERAHRTLNGRFPDQESAEG